MNVLVLAGEIGSKRPMSYGLSRDWNVRVEDIVGPDLMALSEKFDGSMIPHEELTSVINRVCDQVTNLIDQLDPSAIVATGFAADVLMIMRLKREWTGPAVIADPYGYCLQSMERESQTRGSKLETLATLRNNCVWVGTRSTVKKLTKVMSESALSMTVIHHDNIDSLYQFGVLTGCVMLVAQDRR